MLSENDLAVATQLINDGKWTSYIENTLHIRKGSLKREIKDERLRGLLVYNTQLYTNKNLTILNRQYKLTIIRNTVKYGTLIGCLLKNNNCSLLQLMKKIDISRGDITRIIQKLNLLDKLKSNTKVFKGSILKKRGYLKRKDRIPNFMKYHKDELILDVRSGMIYGELCEKYNLLLCDLHTILRRLSLEDDVNTNSRNVQRANRLAAGLLGAAKVRGTTFIRYPLTSEMKLTYENYVNTNTIDSVARLDFFNKYGTAGPHTWNALQEAYGTLKKNPPGFLPGKDNLMYGKEPSHLAGIGIKGHVYAFGEKIHFRSSLELRIYLYLSKHKIEFSLSTHRVQYQVDGKLRNYHPDIVIEKRICEIKPKSLLEHWRNRLKFEALEVYARLRGLTAEYITGDTYDLSEIDLEYINRQIEQGMVEMNETEYVRLLKNIK